MFNVYIKLRHNFCIREIKFVCLASLEAKAAYYFTGHKLARYFGLWAVVFLIWILFFPYAGIAHDAQLYTLQALSHVAPEFYQNDIFLRFGSQDRFTFFSPIYAALIELLGVEWAAALLTLVGHCLFISAFFLLANKIMPYGIAVFAVGLMLTISSSYGAERIFYYIELFVTPRMLSESFVLLSVIAWLNKKNIMATMLLFISVLLHPLMAMAGFVFMFSSIYMTHWRRISLLIIATCFLLLLVHQAQLLTRWQLDAEWLGIIENRNTYLFFYYWPIDDIANALVPLVSLIIASVFSRGEMEKRLVFAALFVGVMAVLVHGFGSDFLHLSFVTQGQAWRWFWLVTLVAILLLPNLILRLWHMKTGGRTVAFTLIAAWLMRSQLFGFLVAVWALLLVFAIKKNWGTVFFWSLNKWMGLGFLLLPLLLLIVVNHFHINVFIALFKGSHLQDFPGIWHECALPVYLLLVCLLVSVSVSGAMHAFTTISILLGACTMFLCWGKSWLPEKEELNARSLDKLRELIPVGEDVLTFGPPITVWIGLRRPSYLTGIQMAGIVFSRATALEANRREQAIFLLCPSKDTSFCKDNRIEWSRTIDDFTPFCMIAGVRFVMSSVALTAKGLVELKLSGQESSPHLYQCHSKTTP